jgi:hypothetical protein
VGMTVTYPSGSDSALFASAADWISPKDHAVPPPADGGKVIIADTDHIWGIGGHREWVWMSLTRGVNPIFMDGYDGAAYGLGGKKFDLQDPQWVSLRHNLGYARAYAERMELASAEPRVDACSSGFCLVAGLPGPGAEYLVYVPDGISVTVDLSETSGELTEEWFNPANGLARPGRTIHAGGVETFFPPFEGDAVLYLHRGASPHRTQALPGGGSADHGN